MQAVRRTVLCFRSTARCAVLALAVQAVSRACLWFCSADCRAVCCLGDAGRPPHLPLPPLHHPLRRPLTLYVLRRLLRRDR